MKCPRCGRSYHVPGTSFCPVCRVELQPDNAAPEDGTAAGIAIHLPPILRDALASTGAREDFDEALLRALKAHYPEQATALLPAVTRLIEIETERAGESRDQVARRLAAQDPGPQIVFKSSAPGSGLATQVAQTTVIRIGGQEYHSLDEVPPHLRRAIEQSLSRRSEPGKSGCLSFVLGAWLVAILNWAAG